MTSFDLIYLTLAHKPAAILNIRKVTGDKV